MHYEKDLFRGYNCFAAAIGQHFLNMNWLEPIDTLFIRWTFDFNQEILFGKVWYVGTCVEPSDYLLQYDMKVIEGVKIQSYKSTPEESMKILSDEIERVGSHVVMVDFYFLNSIDWSRMSRFGFSPKHLPHYIAIHEKQSGQFFYRDPLYGSASDIDYDQLMLARGRTVGEYDIDYEYFMIEEVNKERLYSGKDKLYFQFHRFLENGYADKIEEFGRTLPMSEYRTRYTNEYDWAFGVYNALQSIIDSRQNIIPYTEREHVPVKNQILNIARKWVSIRNDFLRIYKLKDLNLIGPVMDKVFYAKELEVDLAKTVIKEAH